LSVRICVLGSGSRGNCTWIATERARLLVDAGFGRRETSARLAVAGQSLEGCDAIIISHEHQDHINGLRSLALKLRVPVYIVPATHNVIAWDERMKSRVAFEMFNPGQKFIIGDIEVTPFSVPHDAAEPVGFSFAAHGIKAAVVTDLGYVPELVKQHVRGCHCLVFESNHDLEMLKVGPYPWFVKQRVMGRHGHLSNRTTAQFLAQDYDGSAQVLVLAHLSETNNHPEIVRLTAIEALARRTTTASAELHLATQEAPTRIFQW
jgi:phosphoribosyl 1,2-cyclic phosphodiesterase